MKNMPNLYPISTAIFVKFLLEIGFEEKRSSGSHHIFSKANLSRPIIVKVKDKQIKGEYINKYLKQIGWNWEDFLKKIS